MKMNKQLGAMCALMAVATGCVSVNSVTKTEEYTPVGRGRNAVVGAVKGSVNGMVDEATETYKAEENKIWGATKASGMALFGFGKGMYLGGKDGWDLTKEEHDRREAESIAARNIAFQKQREEAAATR